MQKMHVLVRWPWTCPRFIVEPHSVLGFLTSKGQPGLSPVMGEGVLIPHLEKGSPPTLNCLEPFLPELIPRGQGTVLLGCLLPSGGKWGAWGVNLPSSCLLLDGNTHQAWAGGGGASTELITLQLCAVTSRRAPKTSYNPIPTVRRWGN